MSFFTRIIEKRINSFFPSGSLKRRFAKGAIWSFIGMAISQGLALLASIVIARFLGDENFGKLGIIRNTVGTFGVFAGFGLGLTATKYIAEFRIKNKEKAGRIISLSMMVAAVSGAFLAGIQFLASPFLASNVMNAPELTLDLQLSVLILLFSAINGVQNGILAGFEAFKSIAYVNLLKGLVSFPLLVTFVWIWGLHGAIIALILVEVVGLIVFHIALQSHYRKEAIKPDYNNYKAESIILWKFSLPAFFSSALVGPVTWISFILLINTSDGYSELGVFSAANQWRTALTFIPAVIGQAIVPMMSEKFGNKEISTVKRILRNAILLIVLIVFPIGIVIGLLSSWIMPLYGEGFSNGWLVLLTCILTGCLLTVQIPVGNVIVASGKMWLGFYMNSGWAIILLVFTWFFVSWGALGLALAYLIAYSFHAVWTLGYGFYLLK